MALSFTEPVCGVELSLFPAGSCVPPLLWQNGVRRPAKAGLSTVFGIGFFPFYIGLDVSLFSDLFLHCRLGDFSWAARLRRFLVRSFLALGFSCSFYP